MWARRAAAILHEVRAIPNVRGVRIEYASLCNPETLEK
jgi:hypothetical protein